MKVTLITILASALWVQGMTFQGNGATRELWPKDLVQSNRECSISATKTVDCLSFPRPGSKVVRSVKPKATFDVTCKAFGPDSDSCREWVYISDWNCWISNEYTNHHCETTIKWCIQGDP